VAAPRTRSRRRLVVLALALGIVGAELANELFMLFPLAPIWLDRHGTTRVPAAPGRIRILLTGDILLGDAATGTLSRRGLDWPFAATRELLAGADLAVGNLEGPISKNCDPLGGAWSYNMGAPAAAALRRAGLTLVTLGNNHIRDCGDVGVQETAEALRVAGLESFGSGPTQEEAGRPVVRVVHGVRLAFVGYLAPAQMLDGKRFPLDHVGADGRWGAALARPARVVSDLALARRHADVVIAVMHLGDRYQSGPTEEEQAIARGAIEAGADAVVGHGPHIAGPVELHRGRPILYSIGNYAFGSGNLLARYSLLAFLDVEAGASAGLRRVTLLPIYTNNRSPWVRYQSKVLVGWKARRVLEGLREGSPARGALRLESGPARLVMDL
jgi:poly-gamma-glutamate capsule biosynthesis protein CapA/YwtB (metallophosphatase superfamily)